ncbi:MAG TPA: diaminopimelate epimerase [Flavobacteriales bacterium]|nr:diaminopimelate epimerase [Flavobacteriales bacterium]
MNLSFSKWQGTGNDFVLVDDRSEALQDREEEVALRLCDRHFGIGSDGLILIRKSIDVGADFHMEFLNPDGSRSFCGNGSRCAFAYWSRSLEGGPQGSFTAIDGRHLGKWEGAEVSISLPDLPLVHIDLAEPGTDFVNTGSPHELVWVPAVDGVPITEDGPRRRYAPRHGAGGSNINYVQRTDGGIRMRTYERGVEAETLSCGSGVVAAALSAVQRGVATPPVLVDTRGGRLTVHAHRVEAGYSDVRLVGPVKEVFTGTIEL